MIKAFVTGWPLAHSLSPMLHTHWLERYRIEGSYQAVPKPPDEIGAFLSSLAGSQWAGGNVTIPHKEVAFAACDRLDEAAWAIGAVNTLWVEDGRLNGTNTDAYGFSAHLDRAVPGWSDAASVLVLGAGGAARAIVHALCERGIPAIVIVNRTAERAEALAAHFGNATRGTGWTAIEEKVGAADLIVNTTSLGMKGQPPLELNLEAARQTAIVADIVYSPLATPLLVAARARGLKAVDGLGMLLHQAVPGFEKWFGRRPEVDDELRDTLVEELQRREAAT